MKKTTPLSLLAAAGGLCLLPVTALYAADVDQAAEVTATETNDTMSLSIVVAKGGG
jgi:hypothetical protein